MKDTDKKSNGHRNRLEIHIDGRSGWIRWRGRGLLKWLIALATAGIALWEIFQ